ncbi:MAG: integrase [Anaerolineae bacterium]|jgi:integrase|nr:integrase [Anaerolineae bacterium]
MNIFGTVMSQPADVRGLTDARRDRLIISSVSVDGRWRSLSYYCDDEWRLNESTTNRFAASGILHFSRVPEHYKAVMKQVIYRYIARGRNGCIRPSTSTVAAFFINARSFLQHLEKLKIQRLADVTPLVCKLYVDAAKSTLSRIGGTPIKATTLVLRFLAVETLYELSQYTNDPISSEPWPNTSAATLAGLSGSAREILRSQGRTPLIPDDIFSQIFVLAWRIVSEAKKLLVLRDGMDLIELEHKGRHSKTISNAKRRYLIENKWVGGLTTFNKSLLDIRTACYIVVASLTGCRNHEIAFIQTGACHRTTDDEGETYWWMKSRSTKTGEGQTEWMIPEAGVVALQIMERWAKPYQQEIDEEISRRRLINTSDPEIVECQKHRNALFLSGTLQKDTAVRTLTSVVWRRELRKFMRRNNIHWKLSTHQFRRKFANYAARSQFGDLRYLRDHFKHWSMDMTLGYALNESQDLSLFLEIQEEFDALKFEAAAQWLKPNEPLAGGYGRNLINWRNGDEVTIFKDRSAMIKTISESTAIRSNGHAWCTADDNLCVGNGGLESTRCANCNNAVIGRKHAPFYQGLYDHLKEALQCTDIGQTGVARVQRDIARCKEVLNVLGYAPMEKSS